MAGCATCLSTGFLPLESSACFSLGRTSTESHGKTVTWTHCVLPRTAGLLQAHKLTDSLRPRNRLSGRESRVALGDRLPGVVPRLYATGPAGEEQSEQEVVYFDGGPHIGDLLVNLLLGLTVLWLPITLAAVARAFVLRYRFTNKRITVISGYGGGDRKDFGYGVVKDVKSVPRFIGEWGDIVLELSDGTKVDLSSVPKFREVVAYTLKRAKEEQGTTDSMSGEVATTSPRKGFASGS